MRWDAVLHPIGPLPVATYWIRRALVLGGIIVVLIVLGLLAGAVGGGGSSKAAQAGAGITLPTPSLGARAAGARPTASASPTATPSGTPQATCADTALQLSIAVGAPSYPLGSLPQFVVTVTNTGSAACRRDLGAKATVVTVSSGSDRIWSSGDCPSTTSDVRTLTPGIAVKLVSAWSRTRSLPGCLTTGSAGQTAKAGVYVAGVTLGTLNAPDKASFRLS